MTFFREISRAAKKPNKTLRKPSRRAAIPLTAEERCNAAAGAFAKKESPEGAAPGLLLGSDVAAEALRRRGQSYRSRRSDQKGTSPAESAAVTKRATTFFTPAFSKLISSLSPSRPMISP